MPTGLEDYGWWAAQLGVELGPGTFGENLTVSGFDLRAAWVGERWRIGTCLLGMVGRLGTYLHIAGERTLDAGDDVELVARPRSS